MSTFIELNRFVGSLKTNLARISGHMELKVPQQTLEQEKCTRGIKAMYARLSYVLGRNSRGVCAGVPELNGTMGRVHQAWDFVHPIENAGFIL
jgi:hypothetical protein